MLCLLQIIMDRDHFSQTSSSHLFRSILSSFVSRLHSSQHRNWGRSRFRLPAMSSPYNIYLAILPSFIRRKCFSQRNLHWLIIVKVVGSQHLYSTNVFSYLSKISLNSAYRTNLLNVLEQHILTSICFRITEQKHIHWHLDTFVGFFSHTCS